MKIVPNYVEPCTCGNDLTTLQVSRTWRITSISCPACGKFLASSCISDSPVGWYYLMRTLYSQSNRTLRESKKLPPKVTRFKYFDDSDRPISWREIQERNRSWEKKQPGLQRKPF